MRLSEFKDEKGIEVVAKLLNPISVIATNKENAKAKESGKTMIGFARAILQNNPKEIMAMLAILDDKEPSDYHCNAATVFIDVFNMISDPAFMNLFGLQSKTQPPSGSALENTEARGK